MKKLPLSFVLSLLSFGSAVFAADQDLCEVGVTEINSGLSNTIVAVSYDDLGGGSGMIVSNLVKTANLSLGDQLVAYQNDSYETWTLTESAGGAMYWAKQDNTIAIGGGGEQSVGTGVSAAETRKVVGTGIWLIGRIRPSRSPSMASRRRRAPTRRWRGLGILSAIRRRIPWRLPPRSFLRAIGTEFAFRRRMALSSTPTRQARAGVATVTLPASGGPRRSSGRAWAFGCRRPNQ